MKNNQKYTNENIKNLISNHNWEFIFIGADIDSYSQARMIGIDDCHTANYSKDSESINEMYLSVSKACDAVYDNCSLEKSDWKENLKQYDD